MSSPSFVELYLYAPPGRKPCERRCPACGGPLLLDRGGPDTPNGITRDHLTPRSRGGRNRRRNIHGLCYQCNQERGNTPYAVFLRMKRGEASVG